MKLAVGIIGIILGSLVLLQSCAVTAGSGLLEDQATGGSAAIGMLVGSLFFVAGAFAFGLSLVAAIIFELASLPGLLASTQGSFSDIIIWAFIALGLAAMAFFTWRSGKGSRSHEDRKPRGLASSDRPKPMYSDRCNGVPAGKELLSLR